MGGGLEAALDHVTPSQGTEFIQLLLASRQLCRHLAGGNSETAVFNGSAVFGFQACRTHRRRLPCVSISERRVVRITALTPSACVAMHVSVSSARQKRTLLKSEVC